MTTDEYTNSVLLYLFVRDHHHYGHTVSLCHFVGTSHVVQGKSYRTLIVYMYPIPIGSLTLCSI